jgi:hydrogenase maturation protease
MPVPDSERPTLVLGVGNLLWADEGFGVRAVEALNTRYRFPDRVQLMDGGTQGLFPLPYVHNAQELLILDALDFGLEPSTLCLVTGNAVPQYMGAKKVSMHQTGFQEVLAVALMTGRLPEQLALVGVPPERIDDFGCSLQPRIEAALPEAVARAVEVLETWGIVPETRRQPDTAEPTGPAVRL